MQKSIAFRVAVLTAGNFHKRIFVLPGIMWQDIRLALRALAKNPGFTAVAISALALGIGANATVFSLVNGILFKNLSFPDSGRVLYISSSNLKNPRAGDRISYPEYRDLVAQVKSFASLGAATRTRQNLSDDASSPESYSGARISANGFSAIGQRPILGRDFTPDDEKPAAQPVILLSYKLWENRYGRDPSIVGREIRVNAAPTTVIGVMPKGLTFPDEADFWQPLIPERTAARGDRGLTVFGKLRDGASRSQAQAELSTIAQAFAAQYPDSNKDVAYQIQGFTEMTVRGPIKVVFLALLGAVGFVLLIACANVANLMLARAVGRAREVSIRAALGAGRWRVIRQLLAESLLLSCFGGAIAWVIAQWGIRAFDAAVIPTGKPAWIDFSMDYRAFAYLSGISIAAALIFGLVPALRLSRVDVNAALKEGGRAGAGVRGKYLSGVLVVVEMTLAVVLLTGAGLMMRSFLWAYNRPAGIDTSNILTMRFDLPDGKYGKPDQRLAFEREVAARAAAIPGVRAVGVNSNMFASYEVEGAPAGGKGRPESSIVLVNHGYFDVIRVAPVRGRMFTSADHAGGPLTAIVNRTFATRAWPGQDPVGKRLRVYFGSNPQEWMTVAGMIPDILQTSQSAQPEPRLYVPDRMSPRSPITLMASTGPAPASLVAAFRREVREIDADLPIRQIRSLDDDLAQSYWPLRVFGSMFGIFGGVALLLATVGLYAVVAYGVNQRTREIGVRVALGASANEILRLVFKSGMRQMAIGLVLGLTAAFGATRVLGTLLVGISPTDPLTFSLVALVLIAAATLGCLVPARRAMRVDPVIALRHE